MTSWWLGLAPTQTTVDCGGQTHRLRWTDGALRSLDHDDIDGERALAALGGEPCPCVDLLDRWERHVRDLRVLALGSRGPTDMLRLADPPGPPSFSAAGRGMAMSRNASSVEDDLLGLLGLGGGLPDRLQATVIATWTERIAGRPLTATRAADAELAAATPRLTAALYGRLVDSLRSWLGQAELSLDLELVTAGATPSITRTSPTRLVAQLPFAWLGDVWCRGLATVMGRLAIAATTTDGCEWTLSTVGPALGNPETVTVRLPQPRTDGR